MTTPLERIESMAMLKDCEATGVSAKWVMVEQRDVAMLVRLARACCVCEPSHDAHECDVQEALYDLVTECVA